MKRSIWTSLFVVSVIVLLLVASLKSGRPMAAELPLSASAQGIDIPDGASGISSQGTEMQALSTPGALLDDRALFPEITKLPRESDVLQGVLNTSSQGTEMQALSFSARDIVLDDQAVFPEAATASFYHIPGSVLIPVDSATTLTYDLMGCVHATAGASYLLNAPLEIPDGSHIVLMRLYYNDTSASDLNGWITRYDELGTTFEDLVGVTSTGTGGHGSNYGDLDHIVDTYGWSYVLNVRLNVASSTLQICGIRVMYYAPYHGVVFLPEALRNANP
jgi:hypothetical protein